VPQTSDDSIFATGVDQLFPYGVCRIVKYFVSIQPRLLFILFSVHNILGYYRLFFEIMCTQKVFSNRFKAWEWFANCLEAKHIIASAFHALGPLKGKQVRLSIIIKAITFLQRTVWTNVAIFLKKCDLACVMCGRAYFPCVLRYPSWKKCDLVREMRGRVYPFFFYVYCVISFCVKIVLLYLGVYTSVSLLSRLY